MNPMRGVLIVAVTALLAVGCGSSGNGTDAAMASSTGTGTLDSPDVAGILIAAHSGEIQMAQAALPKLTSPATRDFANMMISDHTMGLNEARGMFASASIVPRSSSATASMLRDSVKRTITSFSNATTNADRQYMQSQVDAHQNLLVTIDAQMMPAAHGDLLNLLQRQRASVAAHLDRARQVLAGLR